MSTVAVIGLDEAGSLLASGIQAAGLSVVGYDVQEPVHTSVPLAQSLEEAVSVADIVISLNTPVAAMRVAEQAAQHLKPGALYVDANTVTPGAKRKLSAAFPPATFVDLALMGSLAEEGMSIPMNASGAGAISFVELFVAVAPHLEYVSDVPGDAAARNLLRSFLSKALTSAVIDTLWAAETLEQEEWTWAEIQETFNTLDAEAIQRMISETAKNFKRNQVELMDVVELFTESGYESTLAAPIQFNYGRIMHNKKIPFADPVPTQGTWTPPNTL